MDNYCRSCMWQNTCGRKSKTEDFIEKIEVLSKEVPWMKIELKCDKSLRRKE